jgi:RNA polymerase sigma-70 factor (ECF subfamily)
LPGVLNRQSRLVPDADVLFTAHRDGVFRYLCRIVGYEDARELTQEVFLRVTRAAAPESPGSDPAGRRAWVFRIARNLALNHVRDDRRRAVAGVLPDDAATPATQALAAALREALEQLSPVDRDVFLMREAGGLSYEEISFACQLTADAVRSRLHRARQQLRAALGPGLEGRSNPSWR